MNGIIRKLKLSYPIVVGGLQKIDLFCVEDTSEKFNKHRINSIDETVDSESGLYTYRIYVEKDNTVKLWKSITPANCTVEVEYIL